MLNFTPLTAKIPQHMKTSKKFHVGTCRKYLDSVESKINKDDFSQIPKTIKWIINKLTPIRIKELAKMNCFAANKTKEHLDKFYGKDNYTLISIGRSTASIAETMKSMGVDTKIIPLSGLRFGLPPEVPNTKTLKKYLNSVGLSKSKLAKNPNRAYIMMDYTFTGSSLRSAEELFKQNSLLGNAPNLISKPINMILYKDYNSKKFDTLFAHNRFKDFSPVGKLSILEVGKIFRQSNPNTAKEYRYNVSAFIRKLFKFNVLDSLEKQNFHNCSAVNEIKAIKKHEYTSSAFKALFRKNPLLHEW